MLRFVKMIPGVLALLLAGCGGGGGGGGDAPPPTAPPPAAVDNVAPIQVGPGAYGILNLPMVSVTVCAPGDASRCHVLDNILLDTGSVGLRVVGATLAVVAPNLALPQQGDASGNPLYECIGFIDGSYAWGGVRRADVRIAGKVAANIPIQVIGDVPAGSTPPSQCTGIDPGFDLSIAANLGANGILGVSNRAVDCSFCTDISNISPYDTFRYFTCSGNSCTPVSVPLTAQVKNPVAAFASDNNGVVVQLPAISALGSPSVNGTLTFGINTRSNNGLGSAHLFDGDYLETIYNGTSYRAFIDSGSNALFFDDAGIPQCSGSIFFCPPATLSRSAVVRDYTGASRTVNFSVASLRNLPGSSFAFNNVAGFYAFTDQSAGIEYFDWGLPFFFGRAVYFGMEGGNYPYAIGF